MGKNKEKKTSRGVDHVLLEVSQDCTMTHGYLEKEKLETDPIISEKAKKKRKREDLSDQPDVIKILEIVKTGNHKECGKQKKKKKARGENVVEDAQSCEPDQEHVDEETPRKKKEKRRQSIDVTSEKFDSNEDANITIESINENTDEPVQKKKKKDKTKHKSRRDSAEHVIGVDSVVESFQNTEAERSSFSEPQARKKTTENDSCLVKRLKDFFPNLNTEDTVTVQKMIIYDLPRFEEFEKKGILPNQGKFTAAENRLLKKNVEDFMALTGIDSATKLFFTDRFKDEQQKIHKLKRQHHFFENIAEGIPKTCQKVYARGRKVFDPRSYKGAFTKGEIHTLKKMHTLHGNNWKKISDLTGRSAYSLQKRFTQLTSKAGIWSPKEVQRLLRAVRDYIISQLQPGAVRVSREILYNKLPWQNIAEKVKTRSCSKCREKWMSILAWKMSHGTFCTEKKSEEKVKLIKAMYEMQIDDVAYVNWEDLTAVIGDVPPFYVQRKWHKLKVAYVPLWQTKSFAEIIDFLYEKVLPRLVKELKVYQDCNENEMEAQTDSFFLSDIFQDVNEEDVGDD